MSATESTKIIPITVTAEDNTPKNYTVTVRRAKSSNTNLNVPRDCYRIKKNSPEVPVATNLSPK